MYNFYSTVYVPTATLTIKIIPNNDKANPFSHQLSLRGFTSCFPFLSISKVKVASLFGLSLCDNIPKTKPAIPQIIPSAGIMLDKFCVVHTYMTPPNKQMKVIIPRKKDMIPMVLHDFGSGTGWSELIGSWLGVCEVV